MFIVWVLFFDEYGECGREKCGVYECIEDAEVKAFELRSYGNNVTIEEA